MTALRLSLIPACLLGYFGWLLWGFRWFQLAYWFLSVDCFGAFADFSLPIGFFRLTALTFSLILACLSCFFGWLLWGLFLFQLAYRSSLVDCFSAFADFSLLFGFFGWLLWGLFLFQLAYWPLWLTALALSLIPACLLASFSWLLWGFRWFQLAYRPLWLTALALSLIPACFSPSTLTVTSALLCMNC